MQYQMVDDDTVSNGIYEMAIDVEIRIFSIQMDESTIWDIFFWNSMYVFEILFDFV